MLAFAFSALAPAGLFRSRHRGSVMMETVIVMPILLFLIFMLIQFAHVWTAKQMVSYAAFCATRAITVVKCPGDGQKNTSADEQHTAALNAAKMALSWMCLADGREGNDRSVTVPGWGKIYGSGSAFADWDDGNRPGRVQVEVVERGKDNDRPVAAVKVVFRFPLMISALAVNKVFGTAASRSSAQMDRGDFDFYRNLNRMAGNPVTIDGWPYVELSETCVLPLPYSTEKFPTGGFEGCELNEGGS